jgi:hypothetical protein
VKNEAVDIGICFVAVGHVATLSVLPVDKQISCTVEAPDVVFVLAVVTLASFKSVACLGTTAIVYTANVSTVPVAALAVVDCDPMT